jgi:hypothetical protein
MQRGGNQIFASPEEALKHHGVKGMRWGVRKAEASSARLTGQLVAPSSSGSTMGHGLASMELTGNDLTVDRSKGYAEFRPAGFPANEAVARRHAEVIAALDEVRAVYPKVANLNIEVVPMSRVPQFANETQSAFASVQGVKPGEARIMYNDVLGELAPHQEQFVKGYMPGVGTKNYIGYHEMGHVLAVANGVFPPSHDILSKPLTPRGIYKYDKLNQKQHKKLLKENGLPFKKLKKLSKYSATMPSEAFAELVGHTLSPVMRSKLDPDTLRKSQALINQMGGVP